MSHAPTILALILLLGSPAAARAQAPEAGQAEILSELRRLRGELDQARRDLAALRAEVDQLKQPEGELLEGTMPVSASVELLQAQVAEQAQTKVESGSRLPVRIFGTIHSNVAANSGQANWLENPNIVAAPTDSDGSYTQTLRQSRLGLSASGLTLGAWQGSGLVMFDFFGGMPAFQTGQVMGLPRLVYGFARLESQTTAIEVGQDDMMLAPRNPTSVAAYAFPLLFRSGNLYLRTPQARVESRLAGGADGELRAMVGIVAPVGGDVQSPDYTFVPPALGGERSRTPGVQARLAWRRGDEDRGASLGVSGHYSREKPAADVLNSWAAAVDFNWQGAHFGVAGEGFVGDNLDQFGGALGQRAKSAGGFLEARIRPVRRWELVFGGGTDRPDDEVPLMQNDSAYGSVTFRLTPEVTSSVEYRWLQTRAGAARRRNDHVNWAFTYSF